jgi:hypothetical protein
MKKSIVTFLMLTFVYAGMYAQQKQISYIKTDGAWYQVYDESGKKVTTVSKQSVGKVVGWGSDFFVSVDGAWIKVYDITGNEKVNCYIFNTHIRLCWNVCPAKTDIVHQD